MKLDRFAVGVDRKHESPAIAIESHNAACTGARLLSIVTDGDAHVNRLALVTEAVRC